LAESELLRNVSGSAWENPLSDSTALGMTSSDFNYAVESVVSSNSDSMLAFLIVDAPKLRTVRRTFGAAIGEEVINEVARRCRLACINRRYLVGQSDLHLLHILVEVDSAQDSLEALAKDFKEALGERVQTSAVTVFTPIHIGMSPALGDTGNYDDTVRETEIALDTLHGHQSGGHVGIYKEHMKEEVSRRNLIVSRLQNALERNIIDIFFQPKVSLRDNRIIGAEALIRWTDDVIGYISPLEILDVVEETNQSEALDFWVIKRVCKYLVEWQSQDLNVVPISINVSGLTLNNPEFIKAVSKLI